MLNYADEIRKFNYITLRYAMSDNLYNTLTNVAWANFFYSFMGKHVGLKIPTKQKTLWLN